MCWKISYRIEMICKELGIEYHSKHLDTKDFHRDAIKLQELFWKIKQLAAEVVEIADKHGDEDLAGFLWKDIQLLEHADHDINKLAKLMEERGKESK